MVSHDCVAFYLLSQEVAKHVKVVQSGQGADEVFAGYHWYPPMGEPAAASVDGAVASYRAAFFDRDTRRRRRAASRRRYARRRRSRAGSSSPSTSPAPAPQTGVDRALRLDTTVMLVDDPVKRVDNMTMAWGLEGRVPFLDHELVELAATCPPELKTAHDGKGVLKEAARRVIPAEVIDRPKGYFPVPALTHLEGPVPRPGPRRAVRAGRQGARAVPPRGRRRAARRPQRPADPAARQRALADRAAGTVAAAARHHRARGMTAERRRPPYRGPPRGDHARPARRVAAAHGRRDGRRRRARTRLGPADFRPDVRRPGQARRGAAPGRAAAAATSASTPASRTCWSRLAPAELFIDPSHTYRLRFSDDDCGPRHRAGFTVRTLEQRRRRRRDEPGLRALRDGARAGRRHLGQPPASRRRRLPGRRARRRRHRRRHRDRRRPRAAVRRPGERLEPVDAGRRPDVEPARRRRGADPRARRDLPRPRPRLHGSVGGARQRRRDRAVREAGLRTGSGAGGQAQERDQRTAVHPPAGDRRRPQSVRADHRRRGACGAASGSRCSTPRPARCGCRTAAAASSPESRCRSSPPRWR